ncbi:MAG: hypothetical protein IJN20_06785 [Oscillospiraceae bacterium]|nr:hypothetical protein [Oscillospiraceae bacterium]
MKQFGKWLAVVLILLVFLLGLSRLEQGRQAQGLQQLENALRRAAVACYAVEGFYPADVDYLCENYGVTYEKDRYLVHYDCFASNLMPDITVVEK